MLIGKKWGFIDRNGNYLAEPTFNLARGFSDGLALVGFDDNGDMKNPLDANRIDRWGYIDKSGKMVINPQYKNGADFSDGLAPVTIGGLQGFIDKSERIVIEPKFEASGIFSEGMAPIMADDLWGFIDKSGKVVVEPKYKEVSPFNEGLALVKKIETSGGGWFFIDTGGNIKITLSGRSGNFHEGFVKASVKNRWGRWGLWGKTKWGFIDKTGEFVIPPRYDWVGWFSQGMAVVRVNGRYGYVKRPDIDENE